MFISHKVINVNLILYSLLLVSLVQSLNIYEIVLLVVIKLRNLLREMKRILALVLFLLVRIKGAPFENSDKETLKHVVDELRSLRKNYEEIMVENKMYKNELEEIVKDNKMLKNELQEMKREWQYFSQSRWLFLTLLFPQV